VSTVLLILLWLIVAVLAILTGVLLTPVKLWVRLHSSPSPTYKVEASVFGGLTPKIPVFDSTQQRKKVGKTPAKKKKKRSYATGVGLVPEIPRFIGDVLRVFHFDFLHLDADFGLTDPADTGHVFGCLAPFIYGGQLPSGVTVSLRPDFSRACFAGDLEGAMHFTPAGFLPPALRMAWYVYGPNK